MCYLYGAALAYSVGDIDDGSIRVATIMYYLPVLFLLLHNIGWMFAI